MGFCSKASYLRAEASMPEKATDSKNQGLTPSLKPEALNSRPEGPYPETLNPNP